MIEFAERVPGTPKWRTHRSASPSGGVISPRYEDEVSARVAATALNVRLEKALDERLPDGPAKTSLQLKVRKALQSKARLSSEEALMLKVGVRAHSGDEKPAVDSLKLPVATERLRQQIASQLAEMPYLDVVLIVENYNPKIVRRLGPLEWSEPRNTDELGALHAYRARIANAYGLSGSTHWGKTKGAIRAMLLPRASQLLQLASVRKLLDEALEKGDHVLVAGPFVFWYEGGDVGWIVKSVESSDSEEGVTTWNEGSIVSRNHGRIVVLPYIKEDGSKVGGHTKDAPGDGPAKPRHPDEYVTIPFKRLEDDLMIGLFGELHYE
jgi:hypothetical protein